LAQRNADKRKQSTQFQKAPETQAVASSSGVFAPDLSSRTLAANYPLNVESVAVATDGRYLYSAGGLAGDPINAVYRYDPVANTWTPLANLPVALAEARAAYAANTNKVYVFGGVGPSSISNQTYVYDIASNTWSVGAFMLGARKWASAAYYPANGKIYVIGGYDFQDMERNQVWEYDPVANTWDFSSRKSGPFGMGGSGTSIVGQYIYVVGGSFGGSNAHSRYDILSNTWKILAPCPAGQFQPAAGAIGNKTYVVGGNETPTATYIYDIATNTWSTGPNTNVGHSWTNGTAIGNRLVVVCGLDLFKDTNTVETATEPCQFRVLGGVRLP
jgi:N-acetylneuraminic acid mutarotase